MVILVTTISWILPYSLVRRKWLILLLLFISNTEILNNHWQLIHILVLYIYVYIYIHKPGRSPGGGIGYPLQYSWTCLVAQMVKNPPAMWETWVQPLGWEDSLEKAMTTYSNNLAWRIPWTEMPGRLQFMGSQSIGHDWVTKHIHTIMLELSVSKISMIQTVM